MNVCVVVLNQTGSADGRKMAEGCNLHASDACESQAAQDFGTAPSPNIVAG